MEQKKASRNCDRSGRWEEGDYSQCLYTNDVTRVLHTFILVSDILDRLLFFFFLQVWCRLICKAFKAPLGKNKYTLE